MSDGWIIFIILFTVLMVSFGIPLIFIWWKNRKKK